MSRTRFRLVAVAAVVVAVVAVVVATSGASTKKISRSAASGSAISLAPTSVGHTLADVNGRTLYLFEGDKRNVSTLSAAGRAIWPLFTATSRPRALNGVIAG